MGRLARLHRLHRIFKMQETGAQRLQPGLRLVGQFQPLGGAAKQHHAQQVFQRADLLAHGGGVTASSSAARVKDRWRAAASNTRRALRGRWVRFMALVPARRAPAVKPRGEQDFFTPQ
jgi:hypothetical protein